MNDPNGLIYFEGEYHLFYQYNPEGIQWGNMSWGHAVSSDMIHWKELPVAIWYTQDEGIFSGSAVIDQANSAGFGTNALVAIYTSWSPRSKIQAQSIAYSTNRGRNWKKYERNPVLDLNSMEFRDPKVQWYEPTKKWIMTVVLSADRKIAFYESKNLKDWIYLSSFGPMGAVGGVWECPDLFPLPVDGNISEMKWILLVNLNPGGIYGGSGSQYFIGDFDGKQFKLDSAQSKILSSQDKYIKYRAFQNFEKGWMDWTVCGNAFELSLSTSNLGQQTKIHGIQGSRGASSLRNGLQGIGTAASPLIEVTNPFLSFLIGGTRSSPENRNQRCHYTPPKGILLESFEEEKTEGWTSNGQFVSFYTGSQSISAYENVTGQIGNRFLSTLYLTDIQDNAIESPQFVIVHPYINFLIAGDRAQPYNEDSTARVELIIDGIPVFQAFGKGSIELDWMSWDVSLYINQNARLKVHISANGGVGLLLDHILMSRKPATPYPSFTGVQLLYENTVVDSATGPGGALMDWRSFNVTKYMGLQIQLKVVDASVHGYVLADQFFFSDRPLNSSEKSAFWVDYGSDFYAANTWNYHPDGKHVIIAWMTNLAYAWAVRVNYNLRQCEFLLFVGLIFPICVNCV
jgi:levanase